MVAGMTHASGYRSHLAAFAGGTFLGGALGAAFLAVLAAGESVGSGHAAMPTLRLPASEAGQIAFRATESDSYDVKTLSAYLDLRTAIERVQFFCWKMDDDLWRDKQLFTVFAVAYVDALDRRFEQVKSAAGGEIESALPAD